MFLNIFLHSAPLLIVEVMGKKEGGGKKNEDGVSGGRKRRLK